MFLFWACYQHAEEEDSARHCVEKESLTGIASPNSKDNAALHSFGTPAQSWNLHFFSSSFLARSSHKYKNDKDNQTDGKLGEADFITRDPRKFTNIALRNGVVYRTSATPLDCSK